MFGKSIPCGRIVSQLKFPNYVIANTSLFQVTESDCLPLFGFMKRLFIEIPGKLIQVIEAFPLAELLPHLRGLYLFFNFNLVFICQATKRFRVGEMLILHQKIYRITRFSTTKTFVDPFSRGDGKRRCFFIVERTQSDHIGSSSPESDKISNHLFDPGGGDNRIDRIPRNHDHQIPWSEITKKENDIFRIFIHKSCYELEIVETRPGDCLAYLFLFHTFHLYWFCSDLFDPAD